MASFLLATSIQKAKKNKALMKGGLQGKKVTFRKYQGAKNIAVLVFPLCVCMLLVQLGIFH